MERPAPHHFANLLAAFNLDRFGAGRHIIRDERGWRVRDIQAEYIWIATIRPAFASPCVLALLKTIDGFQILAAVEGDDGVPVGVSEPIPGGLDVDPIFACLETNRLNFFGGGISLDGVSYSLSVRSFGSEFDIDFSNPTSGGLLCLANALWSAAEQFGEHYALLQELMLYGRDYEFIKKGEQGGDGDAEEAV